VAIRVRPRHPYSIDAFFAANIDPDLAEVQVMTRSDLVGLDHHLGQTPATFRSATDSYCAGVTNLIV
jgi:hypothetical protein